MATEGAFVMDESYIANADLSAKQYFLVKLHTVADQVALVAAVTDRPIGILQNDPDASGKPATVRHLGKSKANVDGSGTAIAIGDYLGPDANGRLVKVTTVDRPILAQARRAATTQGSVIEVTLMPFGFFRTAA